MSEQGTEAGTPQRKKKAREQGDSVHSRELLSAVAMLAGVVILGMVSGNFVHLWRIALERSLAASALTQGMGDTLWISTMRQVMAPVVMPLALVMGASFLGALGAGLAQSGGLELHPSAIGMKLSRLNPIANLGNLFSLRSVARIAKSLIPAAAMVLLGWSALKGLLLPMPVLSVVRLPFAFSASYRLAVDAAWITLAWSGLDYAVEWVAWNKRMKMSVQQIKEEMKEQMGNPQVKGRVRQVQNAMRRRRVKADLSKASVIITNPTHYAVALEFSFETMQAPKVLAKGRDLHAAAIREEARWAGIPMIENPPLARSLYRMVEPGQSIPFELYAAVAGILAFLYREQVEDKLREERRRTVAATL